jgi:hypothetical protein
MSVRPRFVPALLGVLAGVAVGYGIFHLLLIGDCSSPPGPGEVACPPGTVTYFFCIFGGIFGGVATIAAGGGWFSFCSLFAGIGVAGVRAGMLPPEQGGQRWFLFFGACFLITPVLALVALPVAGLKRLRVQRLMATGLHAVGTVLNVADTGVTINDNPRLRIRFRIEPQGGVLPPFEAEKTATVPRIDIPRVGDRFPVWLDPHDPRQWVVATGTPDTAAAAAPPTIRQVVDLARRGAGPALPPPASAEVIAELGKLNELRLAGAISAEEFASRTNALLRA